jgi:hypothetical protein
MHCRSIRVLRPVGLSRKGVATFRELWPTDQVFEARLLCKSSPCRASNTCFKHPNVARGSHVHGEEMES